MCKARSVLRVLVHLRCCQSDWLPRHCPAVRCGLPVDGVAGRGISIWSPQLLRICCIVLALAAGMTTRNAAEAAGRGGAQPGMASASGGRGLRRTTGGLFVAGAVAFAAAAMVLSSTYNWPDILREPASVVLPAFAGGGTSLVWTWFATAWTYAILAVPILLLPAALGRRDDLALRVATYAGATSVVLALTGFLRWVFVVPPLARSYVTGDAATRAAVDAA